MVDKNNIVIKYVAKTSDYWVTALNKNQKKVSVPYGLKVQSLGIKDGREYFKVLEGVYDEIDKVLSFNARGKSYLITGVKHRPAISVRFNLASQTIYFGSRGPYNAFSGGGHDGFTQVKPGTYQLAIPAYPADAPRSAYRKYSKKYRLWFRIGTDVTGSRFLHPGMISDGCVTVRAFEYDPSKKQTPPAGFHDLDTFAKDKHGLVGLPAQNTDEKVKSYWKKDDKTLRPSKQQPIINWDDIVDDLILSRLNDKAIGYLVVT